MRTREEIMDELLANIKKATLQETVIALELGTIRTVLLDIRDLLTEQKKT